MLLPCPHGSTTFSGAGKELLSRFHFIVIPVVNPDGYVYTWNEGTFMAQE